MSEFCYLARDGKTGYAFAILSIGHDNSWEDGGFVCDWIRRGAVIDRLPHAEACEIFGKMPDGSKPDRTQNEVGAPADVDRLYRVMVSTEMLVAAPNAARAEEIAKEHVAEEDCAVAEVYMMDEPLPISEQGQLVWGPEEDTRAHEVFDTWRQAQQQAEWDAHNEKIQHKLPFVEAKGD